MLTTTAIPLIVTLCYVGLCVVSPYGNCRKCHGFGFKTKTTRRGRVKRGRDCRRCRGYGRRIRIGRWIYNRAAYIYRDAHSPTPAPGTRPGPRNTGRTPRR